MHRAVATRFEVVRFDNTRSVKLFAPTWGSGGMPPRKFLDTRPSEIVSDAISGEKSKSYCKLKT